MPTYTAWGDDAYASRTRSSGADVVTQPRTPFVWFTLPGEELYSVMSANYMPDLSRIRLTASGILGTVTYAIVERSTDSGATWDVVRGGDPILVSPPTMYIDDYEFPDAVSVKYRARFFEADGDQVQTLIQDITVNLTETWIKSPLRPFLNRTITVVTVSDVIRPGKGGVFEVLGRRLPVAVTEVRGSRRFDLTLRAADDTEVDDLVLLFSFGDVLFLQPPAECNLPDMGHFWVGDLAEIRPPKHDSRARYFTMPLVEVAAPDVSIAGATSTWDGIDNGYLSWNTVVAAFDTWTDVATSVSAPADEVVG